MNAIKKILPNLLTILRILTIPIIVASLYFGNTKEIFYVIATIAFIIASITDFIDGYLARMWNVQSNVGKFLDPIADKLIISTTLIMLIYLGKINNINILSSLTIICREVLVSGTREFMGDMKVKIPVTFLAKVKTTLQMIAIILFTLSGCNVFMPSSLQDLAEVTLWVASAFTIYSGYQYFKIAIKHINKTTN